MQEIADRRVQTFITLFGILCIIPCLVHSHSSITFTANAMLPFMHSSETLVLSMDSLCSITPKLSPSPIGKALLLELQPPTDIPDPILGDLETGLSLVVDTGSSVLWLADAGCEGCSRTKMLCPHLKDSTTKVSYVKGQIQGVQSCLGMCGIRQKFLCVKRSTGMGQLDAEGVMGLKGGSEALQMVKKIIKRQSDLAAITENNDQAPSISESHSYYTETLALSFYYLKAKKLMNINLTASLIDQMPVSEPAAIPSSSDWSLPIQSLSLAVNSASHKALPLSPTTKVTLDTGSTHMVLPWRLCQHIVEELSTQTAGYCYYKVDRGIECSKNIQDFQLELTASEASQHMRVKSEYLVDPLSNLITLLCLASPSAATEGNEAIQQTIILGSPLFRSHLVSFIDVETRKIGSSEPDYGGRAESRTTHNYYVKIVDYSQGHIADSGSRRGMVMVGYYLVVAVVSWGAIMLLRQYRHRRSMKIVI